MRKEASCEVAAGMGVAATQQGIVNKQLSRVWRALGRPAQQLWDGLRDCKARAARDDVAFPAAMAQYAAALATYKAAAGAADLEPPGLNGDTMDLDLGSTAGGSRAAG